jgi:hypothetical protein
MPAGFSLIADQVAERCETWLNFILGRFGRAFSR